jgi:hypothetical protein
MTGWDSNLVISLGQGLIQLLRQAVCSWPRVAPPFVAMLIFGNVAQLSLGRAIQALHGRSQWL